MSYARLTGGRLGRYQAASRGRPLVEWRRSSAVEQGNHNPLVGGSNPPAATTRVGAWPSESDLIGEAFDQPPSPQRSKLFICSSPRTGSYLLCRAMVHHGIGIPHEYFNTRHIQTIGPRWGISELKAPERLRAESDLRRRYIGAILQRRTRNGIFAAKLQGWAYTAYLDNADGTAMFEGGCFIHLHRHDLLGQAISLRISQLTGRWGNDGAITTPPADNANFFDNDQIVRIAKGIAQEDAMWRLFFVQNGILPLTIAYEELSGDIGGTVRRIVDAFALDLPVRDFAYAEQRPPRAPAAEEPSRSAIRENFLRAHRRFTPAALATSAEQR
jgi:LPS sulfotransferase NodH